MISIADRPKLKFQSTFSNIIAVGGFITLMLGIVLPYINSKFMSMSFGLMLGGMILSVIGIYILNRWGRKPRPEESLDNALKKLPDSFRLYHFSGLLCKHILLSPYGVTLFHTINWEGVFVYKNKRWKEMINLGRAIRFPLEQHLGDPSKLMLNAEQEIRDYFKQLLGENNIPQIRPVIIFLHPKTKLEIEKSAIPVCKVDALKKHIPIKGAKMPDEQYEKIKSALDGLYKPGLELKI